MCLSCNHGVLFSFQALADKPLKITVPASNCPIKEGQVCFFNVLQIQSPWSRIYPLALWPNAAEGAEASAMGQWVPLLGFGVQGQRRKRKTCTDIPIKEMTGFPHSLGFRSPDLVFSRVKETLCDLSLEHSFALTSVSLKKSQPRNLTRTISTRWNVFPSGVKLS